MWRLYVQDRPWLGRWAQWAGRQPSWVVRMALAAAALVVVPPLLALGILVITAVFVGALVFVALAAVLWLATLPVRLVRGRTEPDADGRRNVRVIIRTDQPPVEDAP